MLTDQPDMFIDKGSTNEQSRLPSEMNVTNEPVKRGRGRPRKGTPRIERIIRRKRPLKRFEGMLSTWHLRERGVKPLSNPVVQTTPVPKRPHYYASLDPRQVKIIRRLSRKRSKQVKAMRKRELILKLALNRGPDLPKFAVPPPVFKQPYLRCPYCGEKRKRNNDGRPCRICIQNGVEDVEREDWPYKRRKFEPFMPNQ